MHRAEVEAALDDLVELFHVVGDAAAGAAHGEGGPDDGGEAGGGHDGVRLLQAAREAALRHLEADAVHGLLEEAAVLADLDRPPRGPDEADAEAIEHAALRELDGQVQRGLAADGRKDGVRPLALQDRFHHLGGQRLDVGAVRVFGVGHDRRRVRVHQRHADAFLAEGLDGLRAGIVELAGLADHDRAGADDEDGADGRVFRHQRRRALRCAAIIVDEVAEEVMAVVRARARLRVVLDGDDGQVAMAEPLDRPVVEVGVGEDQLRPPRERFGIDGEPVVLRRDLHLPRAQVLDRMVRAAVPELELEGLGPAGQAQDLVAQADPEDRNARVHDPLRRLDRVRAPARGRLARWTGTRRRARGAGPPGPGSWPGPR